MCADSSAVEHDPMVRELAASCVGRVEAQASLGELTTLKVGGSTRALLIAERDEDLLAAGEICAAYAVPFLVVGRGSNLLVADRGWEGLVITLGRGYRGFRLLDTDSGPHERQLVVAGAAEPMPLLASRLAEEGIAGFAWAAAVPGSIGGAVKMNAGAHGRELADHLVSADVVRLNPRRGQETPAPPRTGRGTPSASELRLGYRRSSLAQDAVVVAATLAFERGEAAVERGRIAEVKAWRRAHQPINQPNCGSVFTNPPGDSAGRLGETAGGKGLRVGGARVSELHANFIVTQPGATAADVHALVLRLQRLVEERHGQRLRPEVVMVGDFEDETHG
ncbi:MAG: UDP-N-acetylmuramate dehydrogenase [Actinomycetota bacterium]|nr:UDP-N-acetylmuramate dehydrogenase [Actinomycetota bacterium]